MDCSSTNSYSVITNNCQLRHSRKGSRAFVLRVDLSGIGSRSITAAMSGVLVIPTEATPYILFQRTDYLRLPRILPYRVIRKVLHLGSFNRVVALEAWLTPNRAIALYQKDMAREYATLEPFLPPSARKILDIGCGVAGIDVFLYHHYRDIQPTFYLLDRTQVDDRITYGFRRRSSFYNSLTVAGEVLLRNGVPSDDVVLLEATDDNRIRVEGSVDLVISLISWGYHYELDTYLHRVHDLLSPGGRLIVDLRKGTPGTKQLRSLFVDVDLVVATDKYERVCAVRS